ncbi:MAG: YbhB/YbcL family Raf kinase inhibitor-like protein [Nostocoides sp.]
MDLSRSLLPNPYDHLPRLPALAVRSNDFTEGTSLPDNAGFAAGNVSPHLAWEAPTGTPSLLLSCFDPDAPVAGGFVHWAVILPGDTTELATGAGVGGMPKGTIELTNDYGMSGWGGCAPPEGDVAHRYYFAVTALSALEGDIASDTPYAKTQFLNLANMTARGVIMGTYQL